MATTKLWTADEIEQVPNDAYRYALINGELSGMPPPKSLHGRIVLAVGTPNFQFVEEHSLGVASHRSGFTLERERDTLPGTDLAFVQSARVPADENAYPMLAPDLVFEVASPSQTSPSIEEKTSPYLEAGVRLVWIIDPIRRAVRVRRADGTSRVRVHTGRTRRRGRAARLPVAGGPAFRVADGPTPLSPRR